MRAQPRRPERPGTVAWDGLWAGAWGPHPQTQSLPGFQLQAIDLGLTIQSIVVNISLRGSEEGADMPLRRRG